MPVLNDDINALIDQQISEQQLPASYRYLVDGYLLPLCDRVFKEVTRHKARQRPYVLGVNGGQGSGKSTLCRFVQLLLAQCYQQRCISLSLDDFYLSRAERQQLARDQHPLLQTRGVPGTHNIPLALDTFENLLAGEAAPLPRFDKASDDVVPREQWPIQEPPVDVILFEGWCVGARPQAAAELTAPINALERDEDPDASWRRFVNQQLVGDYQKLFAYIDSLLMLKVPGMDAVYQWRLLQEQKLTKRLANNTERGSAIMDAEQIIRFVDHYERLTRHMLSDLPGRAEIVFTIANDHSIDSVMGLNSVDGENKNG